MIERLALIKPPQRRADVSFGAFSLAVLAAAVRDRVDVSILDATHMTRAETAKEVGAREPDLVGVTVSSVGSVAPAANLIKHLKDGNRGVSVITGGHGATLGAETLLQAGADAAVLGEGELTLLAVIEQGINPGIPGLATLDSDGTLNVAPVRAPIDPLGRLPLPARDLIAPPSDGVHLVETSRGCPHACGFCEATRFHGRRWRPHTPERVAAEVRALVHDHAAMIILFADDNFAADPKRVRRICDLLPEPDLPALFMVSARGDDLTRDPELLPAMALARMLHVRVGVESLDPQVSAVAGKPVAPEIYQNTFRRMRELGVFSVASLIVGLPGETEEARTRSVERLVAVAPDAARFLPFLPLPGTPLGTGYDCAIPRPADVADAEAFTRAFYDAPAVRSRLEDAATAYGVRGALARGALKNQRARV